ncbi:NINE protein [Acidovorax sp. NCPPB 4044]|uniref:NINE protein n=1 Tax=Acidovorax sp. NCPPB 4044 TaxID=2940490 RepID=UPI0023028891|nr:NINE protein [Acidovorax sp. NCPPB 4044]MDA8521813.1 TM2 domain-containing protein [Acidovorax sp. NCPPB 4044]
MTRPAPMARSKNKTVAAWLAFLGGPLGLHRFYLHGFGDLLGWMLPIPTALGVHGILRVQQWGQDDHLSWILIPLLGFTIAGCALRAILYGLMAPERWNARFNPAAAPDAPAGRTHWFTVFAIALSLMLGTAVLMASLAFSFQRYFEYQIEEARKISQ